MDSGREGEKNLTTDDRKKTGPESRDSRKEESTTKPWKI